MTKNRLVEYSTSTVDEAAKAISDQLMSMARKCMPVTEITVRQRDADWITKY